ncbi:MAG: hypothetical protein ACTSUE_03215 [Promethearchaeota archaeon]
MARSSRYMGENILHHFAGCVITVKSMQFRSGSIKHEFFLSQHLLLPSETKTKMDHSGNRKYGET